MLSLDTFTFHPALPPAEPFYAISTLQLFELTSINPDYDIVQLLKAIRTLLRRVDDPISVIYLNSTHSLANDYLHYARCQLVQQWMAITRHYRARPLIDFSTASSLTAHLGVMGVFALAKSRRPLEWQRTISRRLGAYSTLKAELDELLRGSKMGGVEERGQTYVVDNTTLSKLPEFLVAKWLSTALSSLLLRNVTISVQFIHSIFLLEYPLLGLVCSKALSAARHLLVLDDWEQAQPILEEIALIAKLAEQNRTHQVRYVYRIAASKPEITPEIQALITKTRYDL